MLKKTSQIQQSIRTEPETPPNIQQIRPPTSNQRIQQIISSNQQLIYQQMMAMRQLQRTNYEQQDKIKDLTQKYQSLLQFVTEKQYGKLDNQQYQNKNQQLYEKEDQCDKQQKKLSIEKMLLKIIDLEQHLSTTKVELAVKSEELLSYSLRNRTEDQSLSKRRNTQHYDINHQNIENYLETKPIQRQNQPIDKKQTEEHKELVQSWNKLYQSYGNSEFKLSKFKEKSQHLIKKFIPKEMKNKIWAVCVENRLGMTNALYIQLLERRQKGWVQEKIKHQIQKDIKRSFYGKTHYQTKTGIILQVVQFLQMFHIFRPDVSYVQGMTYPAMILIPILGKIKAFNTFCNIVLGNSFFRKLFSLEGNFITVICRAFQIILEEYQPELSAKFIEMGIQSEIYIIEWFFTFFSRGFSIDTTLKFWDHLLFYEEVTMFKMSLSIFQQLGPIILQLNYEETVNFIRQFGQNIKEDKLLEGLINIKLSSQKLYRTLQKVKI